MNISQRGPPEPASARGPDPALAGEQASRFAREAIDFVALDKRRLKPPELVERFMALVAPLEIGYTTVVDLWRSERDLAESIRFSNYPPELLEIYVHRRSERVDPIFLEASRAGRPFIWSRFLMSSGQDGGPMRDLFQPIGVVDGVAVPLFETSARRSVVFVGATQYLTNLAPVVEAALVLAMGAFGWHALDANRPPEQDHALTHREREVLSWTAQGRSARDIANVLDVSEKTVAQHLLNIRMKLHSTNTVQAVARAVSEKLISI